MTGELTQAEMLALAMEARVARIHVSLPGKVKRYDAANQVADVEVMVKRVVPGPEDSQDVVEEFPVLPSVPVRWTRGGGYFVHLPLAVGDFVELVFSERDPSDFHRTGEVSAPVDQRLHHPAHAWALPGGFPMSQPIGQPGSVLRIGKDNAAGPFLEIGSTSKLGNPSGHFLEVKSDHTEVGGATDAASLASKCDAEFQAIKTTINAFIPGSGGASFPTPYVPAVGGVAASKLKLGG